MTLALPSEVEVAADGPGQAEFVGGEPTLQWWLFHWPGMRMDLSPDRWSGLEAHAQHHARTMFETVFATQDLPAETRPRTETGWSPLVDFERIEVDGAPALRSLHRMVQRPGREIVLGHLLVPLASGLFEARVSAADTMTGFRESALMMVFADEQGGSMEHAESIDPRRYDEPEHDAKFPTHCISRARASLRWMEESISVREPWQPGGEVRFELPEAACSIEPPPRFVLTERGAGRVSFERVSFCGTDGVDHLSVEHHARLKVPKTGLERWAERTARQIHVDADVRDPRIVTSTRQTTEGRVAVLAVVEGDGHQGPLRNGMCWVRGDRGGYELSLVGPASVPSASIVEELGLVAESLRPLRPPKRRFRFW